MIKEVGDQGSFQANIAEFQKKGYIAPKQKEVLGVILEAGHAAMHRSHLATKEDLETCMDIMDTLIGTIYICNASDGIGHFLNFS